MRDFSQRGNYRDGRGRGRYDGLRNISAIKVVAEDTGLPLVIVLEHTTTGLWPYHLRNISASKTCRKRLMDLVHDCSTRWVCMYCAIVHVSSKKLICPYPPNSASRSMLWCCRFFFWCPQRVLNGLQRTRLIIRLLAHPLPPSPISKLSLFLSLPMCRRSGLLTRDGEGVGEEPNHTTARKPGPLWIIQYCLGDP